MKACIIILVLIGALICAFYFLDESAREGGIIGALAGIVAIIIVGAGLYSIFSNLGGKHNSNNI